MHARINEDMVKIRQDPNHPIEEDLHKLRLHNYKARFQRSHASGTPRPLPAAKVGAGPHNQMSVLPYVRCTRAHAGPWALGPSL